jgi:putative endonuclease
MSETRELGVLGEKLACEYLVEKGFKILGRNWSIKFGEIDIIARKKWKLFAHFDKTIHFIEVKTITSPNGVFYPEERVDRKKRQKLRRMAEIWLDQFRYKADIPYQIDVIGVIFGHDGQKRELLYFPNALEEE